VSDDLDFPFGRLEYGLQSAGTFVFAIEQQTPNQLLRAGRKLHRRMRVADGNAAAEECSCALLHVLHLLELADEERPPEQVALVEALTLRRSVFQLKARLLKAVRSELQAAKDSGLTWRVIWGTL
jgi:hypothetical protein